MSETTNGRAFDAQNPIPEQALEYWKQTSPHPEATLQEVFESDGNYFGVYGPEDGSFDPLFVRLPGVDQSIRALQARTSHVSQTPYRDVIYRVLGLHEGDGIREQLKTEAWQIGQAVRRAAPDYFDTARTLSQDAVQAGMRLWSRATTKQRGLVGATVVATALSMGIIGDALPGVSSNETAVASPEIPNVTMPQNIKVAYEVPQKPVRVYDLAVGLRMDSEDVAEQLEPQLGKLPAEMDVLPAGQTLHIDARGTTYRPQSTETVASLAKRFDVAPNLLRAANEGLAYINPDIAVADYIDEVVIPKPLAIIDAQKTVTAEEAVTLPGVAEATEGDPAILAEMDPGFEESAVVVLPAEAVEALQDGSAARQTQDHSEITSTTVLADTTTTSTTETTTTTEAPKEVLPPEVERLNELLTQLDISAGAVDIGALVDAVKLADAVFAPNDPDRYAGLPAGYVKMALPHEIQGVSRLRTVAERTMGPERYTTPQAEAAVRAMSEAFAQLIATKYPQYAGAVLRIRDANSPFHATHNYGQMFDLSTQMNLLITQYSDGPVGDHQFSPNYNEDFTVDMMLFAARLRIGDVRVVSKVVSSDRAVIKRVNDALGYSFMLFDDDGEHQDHLHMIFNKAFNLPASGLRARHLPLSVEEDLWIAGRARTISPEKHSQLHGPFEQWFASRVQQATAQPAPAPAPEAAPAPAPVLEITPGQRVVRHIDALDLEPAKKEFLKTIVPVALKYANDYKLNPQVLIAQACLESAYGQSELAKNANNFFGVRLKPGDTQASYTTAKNPKLAESNITYRKYETAEQSVADYAKLIASKEWYQDALAHADSVDLYLRGLQHELKPDGSIARRLGTKGVLSYSTTPDYEDRIKTVIQQLDLPKVIK